MALKLYLLRPVDIQPKNSPWKPWYDKAFGFVVRADSEGSARVYASDDHGDEGANAWLDSTLTSCEELTGKGGEGVILRDFASA